MNNMFPPINTHSRPPSEDLHGVSSGGIADIHSASKHQQSRRNQQTIDQQRRSPLRSNSLLTTPTAKIVVVHIIHNIFIVETNQSMLFN